MNQRIDFNEYISTEKIKFVSKEFTSELAIYSKDDSDIDKTPVRYALQKAGVDTTDYSQSLLDSPELYNNLKSKKLLLIEDDDTVAAVKIKELLDDLRLKHVRGKTLVLSTDLNDLQQLSSVITKLANKVQQRGAKELSEKFQLQTDLALEDNALNHTDKLNVLSEIMKKLSSELKGSSFKQLRSTLSMLSMHLKHEQIKENTKASKEQVTKDLQFLENSGGKSQRILRAKGDIPFPIVSAQLQLTRTHELTRKNDRNLFKETTNQVGVKAGGSINKLLPSKGKDLDLATLTGGGNYSKSSVKVYRTLKQLVDDIAAKPSSAKKALVGVGDKLTKAHINELHGLTKQQNVIRDNTDKLSHELRSLNLLEQDEELKVPAGYSRKLPQHRTIHRGVANLNASLGTDITPHKAFGASINIAGGVTVTQEYDYSPKLKEILNSPDVLEHYLQKHSLSDLAKMRESIEKGRGIQASDLGLKKRQLQQAMIQNLEIFNEYTQGIREHDSGKKESNIGLGQHTHKLWSKLQASSIGDKKHEIEQQLKTKGRGQTLEKILVTHGALLSTYNNLFSSIEKSQNKESQTLNIEREQLDCNSQYTGLDNSYTRRDNQYLNEILLDPVKIDIVENTEKNQEDSSDPISYQHLLTSENKRKFDTLGIDVPPTVIELAKNNIQFETMIKQVNDDISSPEVGLSTQALRAMNSAKRTVNKNVYSTQNININFLGSRFDITVTQAYSMHADPVKNGFSTTLKITGSGNLGIKELSAILERIDSESASEEIKNEIFSSVLENLAIGVTLSAEAEIKITHGHLSFIRGFVGSKGFIGGTVPIASGGVGASIEGTKVRHLSEKIGHNSIFYPQLQFNGMMSGKTIDMSEGTKDTWNEFTDLHKSEITKLIKKLVEQNSQPRKELDEMIDTPARGYIYDNTDKQKLNTHREAIIEASTILSEVTDEKQKEEAYQSIILDLKEIFYLYNNTVITQSKKQRKGDVFN